MNRFFTLLLASSCLTAVGQVPDYVPTDGLVAWYSLDDNGEDQWGEHNANYFSATPTTNRFGAPNRALNFQAGEEQFLRGDAQGLPIADRTVSFWMKTTFEYEETWPFGYGGGPPPCVGRSSVLYFNSGDCEATGNNVAHSAHCCTSVLNVSLDSSFDWTFWCYVNDDNGLRIYQNGVLIGETGRAEDVQTSSSNFYIGSAVSFDGTSRFAEFTGALDDLGLWNRALSEYEIIELYSATEGCIDEMACNYNGDSGVFSAPESCDYSCCPGPGCCGEGTIWNWQTSECDVTNPSDSNFDGCVQLNDLLDLLSVYGDCGAEESAWQCGDPLEYQGYDYETVQIGEQCWFAENLRSTHFRNGGEIAGVQSGSDWLEAEEALTSIYGQDGFGCQSYVPGGDACNDEFSLEEFGRQYNGYAVADERGLCPVGWSIPSDQNWIEMEVAAGLNPAVAFDIGYRGEELGGVLKSTSGWAANSGDNDVGFEGKAGGKIQSSDGFCDDAGRHGTWWTSTMDGNALLMRLLAYNDPGVLRAPVPFTFGCSIRCIQDTD